MNLSGGTRASSAVYFSALAFGVLVEYNILYGKT